jgi:hypothetical protein
MIRRKSQISSTTSETRTSKEAAIKIHLAVTIPGPSEACTHLIVFGTNVNECVGQANPVLREKNL